MNVRNGFLQALAENEDDVTTRLVYADWLDEQGDYEEANRQRKWNQAKEWLLGFARKWNFFEADRSHGHGHWDTESHFVQVPRAANPKALKQMIATARGGEYMTAMGIDLHDADELGGDHDLFWEFLEIYTGELFASEHRKNFSWSCSC